LGDFKLFGTLNHRDLLPYTVTVLRKITRAVTCQRRQGQEKLSVAQQTFGMIRSDPALVRAVLEEDVYEA